MADITTEVLIIGTGPSGSATAALLSSYGIQNIAINRYRWLANTPRAHITNQRAMEVLRDLGPEVEDEAYLFATRQDLMGENIFCESLAGEEIGRMKSWGNHPLSQAEHLMSSPTKMNDLPQTFMEPLLFKTACQRGTQARMSTEYLSHTQDAEGVTTTCRDRLTGKDLTIRSRYLIGADGGKSLVAEHAGLPFEGKMGVGGSMNILFRADLSKYVAHRPSVLYWVMQPGADVGGIGMGLNRTDLEGAGLGCQQGQKIGQTVCPVDQGQAAAFPHGLEQEAGPGGEAPVCHPGPGLFRGWRAQGGRVVEKGRIGHDGIKGGQVQDPKGLGDIAGQGLDPVFKAVEGDILAGEAQSLGISFQTDKLRIGLASRRSEQGPTDPASGLENPLSRATGRGQQGTIHPDAITPGGLTQDDLAPEDPVLGPGPVVGGGNALRHSCLSALCSS